MHTANVTQYNTTHDLLLAILYSELGIYSSSSRAAMEAEIALAYVRIRDNLLSSHDDLVSSTILGHDVSRAADMILFYDLYTGIDALQEFAPNTDRFVELAAYPVVNKMISLYNGVRIKVEEDARAHANQHGDLIRHKIKKALILLNLTSYINIQREDVGNVR